MADKYDEAFAKFNGPSADKYDQAYARFGVDTKSPAYEEGRKANSSLQGLVAAVNGPLMGYGDEVLAALGTPLKSLVNGMPMSENYRELRDGYRGMTDARKDEAPVTTALTQIATSAPMMVLNPLGRAVGYAKTMLPMSGAAKHVGTVAGLGSKVKNAAASGFGYGAVQGVGDSTADSLDGVIQDGVVGGATGAGLGAVGAPVLAGMGAVGRNVAQRFSVPSAIEAAKQKVAEALARDARGEVFTSGQANPITQVKSRLSKLGDEATIADAAGQNTKQLLDTVATMPGRTKEAAEQLIHQRQATRAVRLISAAETGLETSGQRLSPTLESWISQRHEAAAPLYGQLSRTSIAPSDSLKSIVAAADDIGAISLGREMAAARQMPFTLDITSQRSSSLLNLPEKQSWTMTDLDHVKQGLDQKIAKQWDPVAGKLTPLGLSYQDLKSKLVGELDNLTTDQKTGVSLYKSARDAFAGPSALIDAAQLGRSSLSKDGAAISGAVQGLSASEKQAFQLGAFEALRSKLGKEAGQTEILKMWKEPATREKLSAIFGDELRFRSFAAKVAKESRLKSLETVGRGSQTAARQFGAGDLDMSALGDAGGALAAAKSGNVLGAAGALKSAWNQVSTPQSVRDQVGSLLLSKGLLAEETTSGLTDLVRRLNQGQAMRAQQWGATAGSQIGSQLAEPMQLRGLLATSPD